MEVVGLKSFAMKSNWIVAGLILMVILINFNSKKVCANSTIYDSWNENAPEIQINKELSLYANKWYKVIVPKDGIVDIDCSINPDYYDNPTDFIIMTGDKNIIYAKNALAKNIITVGKWGIRAGTYYLYVKVCGCDIKDNAYKINIKYSSSDVWETEPNDTLELAKNLKVNQEMHGSSIGVWDGWDTDYYKFDLEQSGEISFVLDMHDTSLPDAIRLELYSQDNKKLYTLSRECKLNKIESPRIGLKEGKYYLRIFAYSSKDLIYENYQFRVNYYSCNNVLEAEINDNFEKANIVTLGQSVNAFIQKEDVDVYALIIENDKFVKLELTFSDLDVSGGVVMGASQWKNTNWKIQLYNEQREIIKEYLTTLNYGRDNKFNDKVGFLKAGKYYVVVQPRDWDEHIEQEQYVLRMSDYIPEISKVNIKKVSTPSKRKLQLKWTLLDNVNGYELSIATNKKFTKDFKKKNVGKNKDTYVYKKLKRNKKYYIRVRGYLDYDGSRYYGNYSKIKTIKLK